MREAETEQQARARVRKRARALGVRYLVIHADSLARPDIHDDAVRVARVLFESLAGEEGGMEIYKLW